MKVKLTRTQPHTVCLTFSWRRGNTHFIAGADDMPRPWRVSAQVVSYVAYLRIGPVLLAFMGAGLERAALGRS